MIQFIDIETNRVFDGGKPYVHWFKGQQSINLYYSLPILFICDTKNANIKINKESKIFDLISNPNSEIDFKNQIYKELDLTPSLYYGGKYIYLFYIVGRTTAAGEYIESFYINNVEFEVGMDCYSEDETLSINASNFGIELPDAIQKSIYDYNVHDNIKDNILYNRKLKELLTNYWDLMACRGSYKSLINSLKWFEWGNRVKLKEIWSQNENNKLIYSINDLHDILNPQFSDIINNFSKTTYISLYYALQQISPDSVDDEKNPILYQTISKWSIDDISLKMSMLGDFFETYFLPIHLNILHSTIESIVFSNNIKIISGTIKEFFNSLYNNKYINCIINNNQPIYLSNIKVAADNDISFTGVEVKKLTDIKNISDEFLPTFYSNNYNGPGAIVPINFKFDGNNDFIKKVTLKFDNDSPKISNKLIFPDENNEFNITYNILVKKVKNYNFEILFETGSGIIYICKDQIKVEDQETPIFKLYKIINKTQKYCPNFSTILDDQIKSKSTSYIFPNNIDIFNHVVVTKNINYKENVIYSNKTYVLIIYNTNEIDSINISGIEFTNPKINQYNINGKIIYEHIYIQYVTKNIKKLTPLEYKNYILFETPFNTENIILYNIGKVYNNLNDIISNNIFIFINDNYTSKKKISKNFYNRNYKNILKNELVFFPDKHDLQELKIKSYDINDYKLGNTGLCVIPKLKNSDLLYTKISSWIFENKTTGDKYEFQATQHPYITLMDKALTPGYYNIELKYTMDNNQSQKTVKIDSPFWIQKK